MNFQKIYVITKSTMQKHLNLKINHVFEKKLANTKVEQNLIQIILKEIQDGNLLPNNNQRHINGPNNNLRVQEYIRNPNSKIPEIIYVIDKVTNPHSNDPQKNMTHLDQIYLHSKHPQVIIPDQYSPFGNGEIEDRRKANRNPQYCMS